MPLRFDAAELQSYLDEVFPQVRGLFVIDDVQEDYTKVRMPVKEAHLRPGGTVSGSIHVCTG
jgi:acyl-coenzyme A thioesterase PaaI-like protein